MSLTSIIEALLIASEQPLPSSELARIIRARVLEEEEALLVEHSPFPVDQEPHALATSETSPHNLTILAETSGAEVDKAIQILNNQYLDQNRAFSIQARSKGWQIFTLPDYAPFIRQLFPEKKPQRLSSPALETLAIIAYRQPISKAAMEAVRGVSCDGMVQKLIERQLIRIHSRADLPGRPLLYGTTDLFLQYFGIPSLEELPNAAELSYVELPTPSSSTEQKLDVTSDS